MKKIIALSFVINLISCSENKETFERKENKEDEKVSNLKIQTHEFFEIDSSGIVVFPLQIGKTENSGLKGSFDSEKRDAYWNMIFYNTNTGEKHWLSDKKMPILNYETNYSNSYISSKDTQNLHIDNYSSKNYIFYNMITEDFNQDKKLNYSDPTYLFISDKEGKNLKQISPNNLNVVDWKLIPKANKIIINARKDINGNKNFEDDDDEIVSLEYDLNAQKNATLIFDKKDKDSLIKNFKKNWNVK